MIGKKKIYYEIWTSKCMWRLWKSIKVTLYEMIFSTDLGDSSNYSDETPDHPNGTALKNDSC